MRFPEFERAEFEGRWERARARMAAAGLDALLIASEQNFRYLGGLVTPFWVSKSRPLFLLLPLRQDPVLVVTTNQVETARPAWRRPPAGMLLPGTYRPVPSDMSGADAAP